MAGAPRAVLRFEFHGFISITRETARGVTAMVVGSGALLALSLENRISSFLCERPIEYDIGRIQAVGKEDFH
jgi:hypothetical protein